MKRFHPKHRVKMKRRQRKTDYKALPEALYPTPQNNDSHLHMTYIYSIISQIPFI
jgi:hypothetical protein